MISRIAVYQKVPDTRATVRQKNFQNLPFYKKIKSVNLVDIYTTGKNLSSEQLKQVALTLMNPVTEGSKIRTRSNGSENTLFIELDHHLKIKFEDGDDVYSSQVTLIEGDLSKSEIESLALSLHNPLIHRAHIKSRQEYGKVGGMDFVIPKVSIQGKNKVLDIDLNVSDEELEKIGQQGVLGADGKRRGPLALNLDYMKTIREYFKKLGRKPTDIELETFAQTWSEHCKHTIFADPLDELKDGLFKTYIKSATEKVKREKQKVKSTKNFLVSVFHDNSGAIEFNENFLITHKVETHNTPSALDPFGGSITGIVGVNRDCLGFGLGAKPVFNTYGFAFADPADTKPLYRDAAKTQVMLSPKRIMEGVIAGVNAGGNQSGIPTPMGFLYFDDGYKGKPLVFCGTVGLIPKKSAGRKSWEKKARNGDYVVMIGGKVGLDGIHGATFSSESLHTGSPSTAVQIGDPITQKKFSDAIAKEARDMGLYNSITDNGAGGLSSSVGEMANQSGGCEVELDQVPLKYPGLEPWQIWISESQERMILAIPPKNWKKFHDLMARRGVATTVIGKFTKSKKCVVKYHGKVIMNLEMEFLHNGRPIRLQSTKPPVVEPLNLVVQPLSEQLAHPNITSFQFLSEQYDHSVQGTSVIGPLQGKGQVNGKATVLAPVLGSKRGVVLSHSLAPELTEQDPYGMAVHVVESAIRHAVAIGADPDYIALLDNFCWCSPDDPERLWQLKEACRGAYDTAVAHGTPFISGKDSMHNDFKGFDEKGKPITISVPPTLLISAIGIIPDVTKTVTEDFKSPGDLIYLLSGGTAQYRAYYKTVQENLIASAISIGRGGVEIALAKAAIGGMLGTNIHLGVQHLSDGIVVSVNPKNKKEFEKTVRIQMIGAVTDDNMITIDDTRLTINEAYNAYHETFKNY